VRTDRPAEDDTLRATPESRAADTPSAAAGHETLDRVALTAEYRVTVDAAYREYRTGHEWDEAVQSTGHRGDLSLSPEADNDRKAFHVHYRAIVEVEYWDARRSRDADLPALRHADADPLRVFGSASDTHPAEFQAAMARLDAAGVEVDMRPDTMSYSPSAVAGQPGRLILDPAASYGAVLHEISHFADDEAAGFPGLRYWLEDPAVTVAGETRAYQAEIDYANSLNETGIATRLEELKAQRISDLLGENDG
jgi:hypothetical protein